MPGGGQSRDRCAWPASMLSLLSQQNGAFDGTCQVAPGLEEVEAEDKPGPWLWLDSCQPLGAQRAEQVSFDSSQ